MADKTVTLTIQGIEVTVPAGTLLVDAAKQAGIYIPVFCYHPKLEPVGMCRMCLVEIGRPKKDRQSGDLMTDESGEPIIEFGPKLETSCTTPVGEGWVVRTSSERALQGQKQIVEYLLTSHPLDCPVCDKGGECPLQELTMDFGSGKSRFLYDEKMHLAKHVPLGDLIFLDRERCIQCARCTRFQEEVVDDPVIGFEQRGRSLQIVTYSDPGFNSYFSGNTTDICPVGALTTADFRFEARPWELKQAASICPHCPVGCNLTLNTRRQPDQEGRVTIQRIMPRHNEAVNETWICDKGRFAHHFTSSPRRLRSPKIRRDNDWVDCTWEEALQIVAKAVKKAGDGLVGVAGGRASNEDLFAFKKLVEGLGGEALLADSMGGGDWVQKVGVGPGTNLRDLGQGDAILVVASDLHEEAPVWWLRVKQACDRGADLVLVNPRETRLDKFASTRIRCEFGEAPSVVSALSDGTASPESIPGKLKSAAKKLAAAEHLVIFYGQEGLPAAGSQALAEASAALLINSGHVGSPNNGLIPVWPHNNTQGGWDMGLKPTTKGLASALDSAKAIYLMASDPLGDDPKLAEQLKAATFVVVQDLFMTETAREADVVLPAQAFAEREGTYTTGERRVQRSYMTLPPMGETRPDWLIVSQIGKQVGLSFEAGSVVSLFAEVAASIPAYGDLTYQSLAEFKSEWPPVGGDDLYFGGTSYSNRQGLGIQLDHFQKVDEAPKVTWTQTAQAPADQQLLLVPVERLLDRGTTVVPSDMLANRLQVRHIEVNPKDAVRLGLQDGAEAVIEMNGSVHKIDVELRDSVPEGSALLPRSIGVPAVEPKLAKIQPVREKQTE
jgi:NADH-quinone oxidoreductase subunit G